jgi:rubrerythrin/Tfp pilus assembly protein PilZ
MNQTAQIDLTSMRERRKYARKKISVPVRYRTSNKGDHLGYMNDISNGGIFLESNVKHEVGDNILAYLNEDTYGKIVWAYGSVVHTSHKGVGVNFIFFDKPGVEELIDLAKVGRMKQMTEQNLINAYGGESQAHIRYLYFAEQARKEKYHTVARLFKAIAYAEYVHAGNHYRELKHLNAVYIANSVAVFGSGDTKKNLSLAIIGETYEINEMYPVYMQAARSQQEKEALRSFEYSYSSDKEHKKLLEKGAAAVDAKTDVDLSQITVCDICGYTIEGDTPDHCHLCKASKDKFVVFN